MNTSNMVATPLYKFSQEVEIAVKQFKSSNESHFDRVKHQYRPVKEVDHTFYDSVGYSFDRENFQEYYQCYWLSPALTEFINSTIVKCISYMPALNYVFELMKPHRTIQDEAEFKQFIERSCFNTFITFLCKKALQDYHSNEDLKDYIEHFINDITYGNRVDFVAYMYLENIVLDKDEIEIGNDLSIRKMSTDDLGQHTRDIYEDELSRITSRTTNTTAVLVAKASIQVGKEADSSVRATQKLKDILRLELDCFRLFKPNNAFENYVQFSTKSILYYAFNEQVNGPFSKYLEGTFLPRDGVAIPFQLSHDMVVDYQEFRNSMLPSLNRIVQGTYFEGASHELAFHRYRDALLRSTLNINRLVYSIYSMDAALVRDSEMKQQKDKLLTRAARLIQLVTEGSMGEIRNELLTAYTIRNVHVHGGKMTDEQKEFSLTHTMKVLNYARLIVSMILQLYPRIDKEGLIDRLESSNSVKEKLREFKKDLETLRINY